MSASHGLAIAATFLWLGMVIAISFVEAPLKFRAPGITVALGLGIGRLVFRALNGFEVVWAVLLLVGVATAHLDARTPTILAITLGVLLAIQVGVVRPVLQRRSDAVLAADRAGSTPGGPSSHVHLVYVAVEVVKVVVLGVLGWLLLAG